MNRLSKKDIYVYSGPGAANKSIKQTLFTLEKTLSHYTIRTLSLEQLLKEPWEDHAALFILPGGADIPYVRKLNGSGNQKIRRYVENGGAYLGICAGSYYAGNYVDFAKNSPIEVQGERELSFFPGTVCGPLLAEYDYQSEKGSLAATIYWTQNTPFRNGEPFTVFFGGGGYFVNARLSANTTVLAHYCLGEDYPAIVECSVGQGISILSGVHFEYDPSLLDPNDPYLKKIIPDLEEGKKKRNSLISHLWERLHLI